MTTACRLVIRGQVQGVGFRDGTVGAAREHGVAGWVRNRRDGSVEALAQGSAAAVAAFVAWCRCGPPAARVIAVEIAEASVDPALDGFEWRSTA
jgi:acylphosphatase